MTSPRILKNTAVGIICPEEKGVVIAVGSIYGNTEEAAVFLVVISLTWVSRTSSCTMSHRLTLVYPQRYLSLLARRFNIGDIQFRVFPKMEDARHDIVATELLTHFCHHRNGSWAPAADNLIRAQISKLKNARIINQEKFTIKSALKAINLKLLKLWSRQIAETI
jgi:hypothetical protein